MEFLTGNYVNTTTQITVNSNTSTVDRLFNRDPLYQYYSASFADDNTTSSILITFDQTTNVSRIALVDTNFKEFRLFYNGATANSFALSNADTTASVYTGNADDNKYFRFPTTACTSITIEAKKTQTANQEKLLGLLVISDLYLTLSLIPNARGYKPKIAPKQIVHKMSDGGSRIHNVKKKWEAVLDLDYVNTSQRDSLRDIYELGAEFNFCPFGTATGWDALLFEAIWDGPFQFYEFSDNASASGFSGKVTMKETPS